MTTIRRDTKACVVDGCSGVGRARGMCSMHYARWRRKGDAAEGAPRRVTASRGCSVEGCSRPHYGAGYCNPHYQRLTRSGDPTVANHRPRWVGEAISYDGMHQRLRASRGKASEQWCDSCDGRASDWAYDHDDPAELIDPETGYRYSLDSDHYRPMCRSCHTSFDARAAA